jgi:hypothetical protein
MTGKKYRKALDDRQMLQTSLNLVNEWEMFCEVLDDRQMFQTLLNLV